MINTMRQLALIELNHRFNDNNHAEMHELRQHHAADIFPFLVENPGKVKRVYVLTRTANHEVQMNPLEVGSDNALPKDLPFVKPSGAQSPAIGPLIKRTVKKDNPPFGPSPKILNSTVKYFKTLADTHTYFREIVEILDSPSLIFEGKSYPISEASLMLTKAVELIDEKETVFLAIADTQGNLPGQRPEYLDYLNHELANLKYVTGATAVHKEGLCPLCNTKNTTLYPNAIKGAGINIGNADRAGAFTGLETKNAWKNYSLCIDCADLLYIFKNHLLPDFVARIAGEKALVLPHFLGNIDTEEFSADWHNYLKQIQTGQSLKQNIESDILEDFFKEQSDTHFLIQIVWATFGQIIDNINNYTTDILPSRLHQLSQIHAQANQKWQQPFFPRHKIPEANFDLCLNMLWPLLKRPGSGKKAKKAKKANESKQLREIRLLLAKHIYHGTPLTEYTQQQLWAELITTARWYFADVLERGNAYGLYHEGYNEKKQTSHWTLAGWIRHIARFFYYLDNIEVLPMPTENIRTYQPKMNALKPFFESKSGLNTNAKAFAFLVGILYGKLLQVQNAKGINILSSTIPWLKRLQLSGQDLPELHNKIRHKFLTYGDSSSETRQVITEIAHVGQLVGNQIDLDTTQTCYFILLGQALALEVLPSKKDSKNS